MLDAEIARAIQLQQAGRLAESEAVCRALLERGAAEGEAYYILGLIQQAKNRLAEAANFYRQSIALRPDLAEACCNLGIVLRAQGQLDEAIHWLRRAVEMRPATAEFHNNLGLTLGDAARSSEAIACLRRALELRPDFAEALNNLGTALHKIGRAGEAIDCYRKAARLQPDSAIVFSNLGNILIKAGRLDEALACYDRSLKLRPNHPEVYNNLGVALKATGDLDGALACFDRALALRPDYAAAWSSRLYTVHFHPGFNARAILEEHRRWNVLFGRPLAPPVAPAIAPGARRWRIGYVSPDFREHVVARFLLPLLSNHDRGQFEIFCYADVTRPDAMTARLRQHADVWRDVTGLSDAQLAQLVRDDRIDLLIDLAMHMGNNRMLMFARKPAPVQATYLAYCSTTGLETMDYRLTDPYLDPPDRLDGNCYTEQSIYLPKTYWCYAAPEGAPPVGPLPALSKVEGSADRGQITFGCLNNFAKVTRPTLEMWARILQAAPGSRLRIHSGEGVHRQRLRGQMGGLGIDPDQIDFAGFMTMANYLQEYQQIDIALDPFPYGGGTTTCDALWMGVPVISRTGDTAVSRAGSSILSNLGLATFVASTADEYVRIALELAGDLPRLAHLRGTLRDRMLESALMDAPAFARAMEDAYRTMMRNQSKRIGSAP